MDKYENLISTKTLFFSRYDNFEDKFEGSLGLVPPKILTDRHTERLRQVTSMPQDAKTLAREFLQEFEPLLYQNFLRNLTFINCWHLGKKESSLMWKIYASKGIMIKTDLHSLKCALGINDDAYHNSEIFWHDHGLDELDGYEISMKFDKVKYPPRGTEIQTIGFDRYFHKQPEYASEKEFRVLLQVQLGNRQRPNYPFLFRNVPFLRNEADMNNIIEEFWEDLNRTYNKHKLLLSDITDSPGIRCRVDINTLIKEVVISPFDNADYDIGTIESMNQQFNVDVPVRKSSIVTSTAPTRFSIRLSNEINIDFEL